ncbi:MAG TPA: serine protease [Chthoniobacter sp.]|nr:serine protease [Chthoniobacter sp.]
MKIRAFLPIVLAMAALARPSLGIIVINPNERECLAAPTDGSPWNYVARLDNKFGARATGVYLGNRYVLTANHVDKDLTAVHLNGQNYTPDSSFQPVALQGTDLRVLRIKEDPGLAPLRLIGPAESEFKKPCVMIGYGLGKGAPIAGQGWQWNDDQSRLKRWATNTTLKGYKTDPQSHITYVQTAFDIAGGPSTGQLANGDSGCGLFVKYDGVWKLVGIGADVDSDKMALYDKEPGTQGNQPDHSYFVAIHHWIAQINRIREN